MKIQCRNGNLIGRKIGLGAGLGYVVVPVGGVVECTPDQAMALLQDGDTWYPLLEDVPLVAAPEPEPEPVPVPEPTPEPESEPEPEPELAPEPSPEPPSRRKRRRKY